MSAPGGTPSPYRSLMPGPGPVDTARAVRTRRTVAAIYATLGLLLPIGFAARVVAEWWTPTNLADPLTTGITVALSLGVGAIVGGLFAVVGLLVARPIVSALLARAMRPGE
jgi:hypothetical protein